MLPPDTQKNLSRVIKLFLMYFVVKSFIWLKHDGVLRTRISRLETSPECKLGYHWVFDYLALERERVREVRICTFLFFKEKELKLETYSLLWFLKNFNMSLMTLLVVQR